MAKNFEELSRWWGDLQHGGYMDQRSKRLAMFAPVIDDTNRDSAPSVWHRIATEWDQTMLSPVDPDKGLINIGYETIIAQICNTI